MQPRPDVPEQAPTAPPLPAPATLLDPVLYFILTAAMLAGTLWEHNYLSDMEARGGSFYAHLAIVLVYDLFGKNGVTIALGLFTALFGYLGVSLLLRYVRQRTKRLTS